jgi:hypothetical protein
MVMGVAVGAVMALMTTTLARQAAERIAEAALELEWGRAEKCRRMRRRWRGQEPVKPRSEFCGMRRHAL